MEPPSVRGVRPDGRREGVPIRRLSLSSRIEVRQVAALRIPRREACPRVHPADTTSTGSILPFGLGRKPLSVPLAVFFCILPSDGDDRVVTPLRAVEVGFPVGAAGRLIPSRRVRKPLVTRLPGKVADKVAILLIRDLKAVDVERTDRHLLASRILNIERVLIRQPHNEGAIRKANHRAVVGERRGPGNRGLARILERRRPSSPYNQRLCPLQRIQGVRNIELLDCDLRSGHRVLKRTTDLAIRGASAELSLLSLIRFAAPPSLNRREAGRLTLDPLGLVGHPNPRHESSYHIQVQLLTLPDLVHP